jgi:hypothetical protein
MAGTYEVHWDTAANRLEFTLAGMFDPDTYEQWDRAFRAAAAKAPRPGWALLGGMSDFPPQSDAVQKRAPELIGFAFAHGCVKAANIMSKTVTAMQGKRLGTASKAPASMAFVATREEALCCGWTQTPAQRCGSSQVMPWTAGGDLRTRTDRAAELRTAGPAQLQHPSEGPCQPAATYHPGHPEGQGQQCTQREQ